MPDGTPLLGLLMHAQAEPGYASVAQDIRNRIIALRSRHQVLEELDAGCRSRLLYRSRLSALRRDPFFHVSLSWLAS